MHGCSLQQGALRLRNHDALAYIKAAGESAQEKVGDVQNGTCIDVVCTTVSRAISASSAYLFLFIVYTVNKNK